MVFSVILYWSFFRNCIAFLEKIERNIQISGIYKQTKINGRLSKLNVPLLDRRRVLNKIRTFEKLDPSFYQSVS